MRQKKTLLYQLVSFIGISVILSVILFVVFPYDVYPIVSKSPLVEWPSLQLYSFIILPIIAIYVLLAYLITAIAVMRKYRPYTLTIAVALHWLFCAHFFLIG